MTFYRWEETLNKHQINVFFPQFFLLLCFSRLTLVWLVLGTIVWNWTTLFSQYWTEELVKKRKCNLLPGPFSVFRKFKLIEICMKIWKAWNYHVLKRRSVFLLPTLCDMCLITPAFCNGGELIQKKVFIIAFLSINFSWFILITNTKNGFTYKISLLRRLHTLTLPNATPPIRKVHPFSKIAVTLKPKRKFYTLWDLEWPKPV